jgi:autotransporter-associated beta strand protein
MNKQPKHLVKPLRLLSILLTVVAAEAATLNSGYVIGGFGPAVFLDNAGTGGGDSSQSTTGDLGFVVQMTNLWNVGDTIRLTGVALPLRTTTDAGTFTFNFYGLDQGADTNAFEGIGTEILVGSAQATLGAAASAGAYSATFDTPVVFTAASRGIAIQFTNSSANLRVKINTAGVAPNAVRLSSTTGLAIGGANPNMRFTLAGSVVVPPAVGSLVWQGNSSANWDVATTNWNRHLGGYVFTPDKYTDNGAFGPQVIFDDTLASPFRTNINLTTGSPLRPGSMVFANSTRRYDCSGPGKITGATILTNKGPGVVTLNTANDFTGGSVLAGGRIRLGNAGGLGAGTVIFSSGAISSAGAAPLTVTNDLLLTGTAVLGNATDNGVLTLSGVIDFNGGNSGISVESDVKLTGVLTNGGIGVKTGPGTLTLMGTDRETAGSWNIQNGVLKVDGIAVTRPTGAIQVGAAAAGGVARCVITNGATVTISNSTVVRVGVQGQSSNTSTNYFDLAGTLRFETNFSGAIQLGEASTYDELNLYPGSLLRAGGVTHVASAGGPNSTVVNINGATIVAASGSTNFMSGHAAVNLKAGGVVLDTETNSITVGQALLDGGGGGGLTKKGSGTLWLGGPNTYAGATVVQAGTIGLYPGSTLSATSSLTISNGAVVATDFVPLGPGTTEVSSLSLDGSGVSVNYGDLFGAASGTVAISFSANNGVALNARGVNTITLTGQNFGVGQYPVIQFASRTGAGSFVASLPQGVLGSVITNGSLIIIEITRVPASLNWYGSTDSVTVNNNWNTTSLNWNTATAKYSEVGGSGDYVSFNDSAFFDGANYVTNVNLSQPLAPLTLTVDSTLNYVLGTTGAGKITGSTVLTKANSGSLALNTANDHTGGSILGGYGAVLIGNNAALGVGGVTLSGASLSSDGVTARTITNALAMGANTVLGDAVNYGALNLSGPVNFGGGARDLMINSPVTFSGTLTTGGLDEKTGPATLTYKGVIGTLSAGQLQIEDGDFVISGGSLTKSGGGIRIGSTVPDGVARLVITNGAVVNMSGAGLNARVGNDQSPAASGTSTNILDVAGTLAWTTSSSGFVFMGSAGQLAQINLQSGGLLQVNRFSAGANASELNLNGGTLSPTTNQAAYLEGLTIASVLPGGVTFDTRGFDIGVAQSLLNGGGGGGLTKTGSGTLALNGANTYTGLTTVSGGSLGGTGVISGPVTIGALGTLAPGSSIGTLTINNNLTLGGNVLIEVNKGAVPSSDMLAVTGTLSYGGTITVANIGPALVIGDSFPVFPAGGSGTVSVTGDAGPGQAFSLNKTTGVISVVAALPSPTPLNYTDLGGGVYQFSWTGAFKLQWQTNTAPVGLSTNWVDYPNTSNPVNVTNNPSVPTTFFRLINQ